MALIITIDGNIGSGKTTFINKLKDYSNECNLSNIVFLEEPVKQWSEIKVNDITILEAFYSDPKKYAFSFQMLAFISRLSLFLDAIKNNPNSIIISERSIITDKFIFAKMLHDNGNIDDYSYKIYNLWFEYFINKLPEHKHIYLHSDPENTIQRINKRQRPGESKIDMEYLKRCHEYHDDMFIDNNKLLTKLNIDKYVLGTQEYENLALSVLTLIVEKKRHLEHYVKYDENVRHLIGVSVILLILFGFAMVLTNLLQYL